MTWLLAVSVLVGNVYDRTTKQPLAHVHVTSGTAKTMTDARGHYVLRGVKGGAASITFESDDVPAQHFTVTIGNATSHADFAVCSTTLDYNCGVPAPNFGNGNG